MSQINACWSFFHCTAHGVTPDIYCNLPKILVVLNYATIHSKQCIGNKKTVHGKGWEFLVLESQISIVRVGCLSFFGSYKKSLEVKLWSFQYIYCFLNCSSFQISCAKILPKIFNSYSAIKICSHPWLTGCSESCFWKFKKSLSRGCSLCVVFRGRYNKTSPFL